MYCIHDNNILVTYYISLLIYFVESLKQIFMSIILTDVLWKIIFTNFLFLTVVFSNRYWQLKLFSLPPIKPWLHPLAYWCIYGMGLTALVLYHENLNIVTWIDLQNKQKRYLLLLISSVKPPQAPKKWFKNTIDLYCSRYETTQICPTQTQ